MMRAMIVSLLLPGLQAMAQTPLPEAARGHLQSGITALQGAQSPDDLNRAIESFGAAVKAAPDAAEPYFFLGTALATSRSSSKPALDAFRRYLKLAPQAPDGEAVRDEIAKLEALRAWRRTSGGAGFSIAALGKGFFIRSVFPNSPVTQTGLRRGDRLVSINKKPLEGLSLIQVTQLLDGPADTTCLLGVERGGKPLLIAFKRALLQPPPAGVVPIEEGDFGDEVLRAPTPVMLVLWAPWCPFCPKALEAASAVAAAQGGRLKVLSLDVDEGPGLVTSLRVTGIPAVRFIADGRVVDGLQGADPAAMKAKAEALLRPVGRLGLELGPATVADAPGVVIRSIQPGTPAAASVLKPGDRLLAADDLDLTPLILSQVLVALRGAPDTAVALKVARPGLPEPMTVTLLRVPRDTAAPEGRLGLGLKPVPGPGTSGVMVDRTLPGSPAAAQLRPGDRLLEADGQDLRVLGLEQVVARLRGPAGTAVTLRVARMGVADPITVRLVRQASVP
ncbi:MAG: PDZ domain-containing protein [Holophagaceae bacterium]|uniref:PDZ domain-containing protein n=1 Tax=Candidatus Geothrix skivensis TaxID=2954439 RepID=A0A9D7SFK2_9BACT|nr:PDZ domain-containing protein [Candidatus Geothrix skivensis]